LNTILTNEISNPFSQVSDTNSYAKAFGDRNSIVHFSAREMEPSNRWSLLSIHCAFDGNEYYKVKNCTYRISNSKYLVLNEGSQRASFISSIDRVESLSVSFSPQFVIGYLSSLFGTNSELLDDPFYTSPHTFLFNEQLYDYDESISLQLTNLRTLINNLNQNKEHVDDAVCTLFESLLCKQKDIWQEIRKIPCSKMSTKKELYERLTRAKDYVFSCYKENISVNDLANLTCLNKDYFSREFKRVFGLRPLEYIQHMRLSEGKRLLKTTDKTTNEICYEVGYSDPSSFCKLFKRRFNCYPQEYLKSTVLKEELTLI